MGRTYPDEKTLDNDTKRVRLPFGGFRELLAAASNENPNRNTSCLTGIAQQKVCVLHRLCVNPKVQRQGIGARILSLAENAARESGYGAVRLDAFSQNPAALKLYAKSGYRYVGNVFFRKGKFFCYEKKL
jgi:ribosomal protein S18 acetylase RimI-like enzyme